ncbi:MAG TPA: protein phosphatase 2C domain-containing protein [Marmoricola sp.]|nr:protein phosphatase 2C domain-containing protein [Marmoricola sp.]
MRLALHYAALSDVGRVRKDNQDSGYAGAHLLVIADGVGGAARGDIASSTAVEQLRRLDAPPGNDALEAVAGAIHRTHDRIAELVEENPEIDGTSTTVTAALFDGTGLAIGHVGDSRGYLLREGTLAQLTKDHTFVQSLIDEGRITEEEARVHPHRNLILRAVDGVHEPEPDVFVHDLAVGDRVLLCSDGCSGALEDDQLAALLGAGTVEQACTDLVRSSIEAGSSDNVTVVVAEVVDEDAAAALPTAPVVVGAAAEMPRRGFGLLRRRPADTGELEPVAAGEALDPEALRYAPREPRRYPWLRRTGVGVLALAVVFGLAVAGYAWTQTQYFVGASAGHVAVYKGVEADVPGLRMHHVLETSSLRLEQLPAYNARQVRDGIGAQSLGDAHAIVARLRHEALCPPTTTPSPSPTPSASSRPSSGPSSKATSKPSSGPTSKGGATHRPRHTTRPTTRPTASNAAGSASRTSGPTSGPSAGSTGSTGSASGATPCTEQP